MLNKNIVVNPGSEKSFGFVFTVLFCVLGVYFIKNSYLGLIFLILSSTILIITLIRVNWLQKPNMIWFKFGLFLGSIISPIVMLIVYLIIITPYGRILSIFRKDPLNRKYDPKAKTYWIKRDEALRPFKNQF